MMKLEVKVNDEVQEFYGFGQNVKNAKTAAAKMALKCLGKL